MDRLEAARGLSEIGRRLRLTGASPFRAKAFLRGAAALQGQSTDLGALVAEGRLQELRGIGPSLAGVIQEMHRTGRSRLLERLRAEMPAGVLELSRIPTLTVARIRALQEALGVDSLEALEVACRSGQVRTVRGFGPKTEARLLDEIARLREGHGQVHLHRSLQAAEELLDHMRASPDVERVEVAGELRAALGDRLELPPRGDGDDCRGGGRSPALVSARGSGRRSDAFGHHGHPHQRAAGPAGMGSSRAVRHRPRRAHRLGGPLLEAGRAGARAGVPSGLAGIEVPEEAALYARLGLPWIAPGAARAEREIEAAQRGSLPRNLVTVADIRGMVHCHTSYSDGRDSVLAMAKAAARLGMGYITITDHSPSAAYAGGVTVDRLERQWEEIELAQEATGIRILRGTESDILADGSLDYPDRILEKLDVVVASIHNRHRMDARAMTRRVTRALSLPLFKIWGHARGRLINRRPPFECDMEEILDVAAASRVAVEVNGDPYRLDMDPAWIRVAKGRGLTFVVSVDAHSTRELENVRYGWTWPAGGGWSGARS